MSLQYFFHLANESAGILYLMLILLLIALVIIIERWRFLANMDHIGKKTIQMCQSANSISQAEFKKLEQTFSNTPVVRLLNVAVTGERAHLAREELSGNLEEIIMHEVPRLDKSLWILDTIITLAPLLGLFGTIIGMFNAFSVLSDVQGGTSQITSGIAEALVATASGLLIAMIGLFFFNSLNTRIRLVVHQLETLKIMILNRQEIFKEII
jgi:biopolymer transport protein ExbB